MQNVTCKDVKLDMSAAVSNNRDAMFQHRIDRSFSLLNSMQN